MLASQAPSLLHARITAIAGALASALRADQKRQRQNGDHGTNDDEQASARLVLCLDTGRSRVGPRRLLGISVVHNILLCLSVVSKSNATTRFLIRKKRRNAKIGTFLQQSRHGAAIKRLSRNNPATHAGIAHFFAGCMARSVPRLHLWTLRLLRPITQPCVRNLRSSSELPTRRPDPATGASGRRDKAYGIPRRPHPHHNLLTEGRPI